MVAKIERRYEDEDALAAHVEAMRQMLDESFIMICDHMRQISKDGSVRKHSPLASGGTGDSCTDINAVERHQLATWGEAWIEPAPPGSMPNHDGLPRPHPHQEMHLKGPTENAPILDLTPQYLNPITGTRNRLEAMPESSAGVESSHFLASAKGSFMNLANLVNDQSGDKLKKRDSKKHINHNPDAPTHEAKAVFADAAAMKEKVRAAINKKEYNVADFYWETGFCQSIARSMWFEYLTLFVIAFNAIWIWIDADYNPALTLPEAPAIFQIAEHSFCLYFSAELLIRFLSFKTKKHCLRDGWFVFDSILVVTMVGETWVLTLYVVLSSGGGGSTGLGNTSVLKLFRLVRLTRMARMAKLLRAIPELIILVKGMAVASRSVGFTLLLLGVIVYFFAIVFRQLTDDSDLGADVFPTVPEAMATLLLDGVLPDQAGLVRDCGDANIFLGFLCLIFVLLATLTVMNMLVGVLCEVVSVVSSVEKESLAVTYVKMRLSGMFGQSEEEADHKITKEEFSSLLMSTEAARTIQEVGVDVVGLVDFSDYIFKDTQTLSFGDFMELILSLRGSNTSTVKDIVDLRKFILDSVNSELKHVKADILTAIAKMNQATENKIRKSIFPMSGHNSLATSMANSKRHHMMAIPDAGGVHPTGFNVQPRTGRSSLECLDIGDVYDTPSNNNEREQPDPTNNRPGTSDRPRSSPSSQDKSTTLPIVDRRGPTAAGNAAIAQGLMNYPAPRHGSIDTERDLGVQSIKLGEDMRQANRVQRPTSSGSSSADRELARRFRQNNSRPGTTESARSRAESPPLPKFSRQMWLTDEANTGGNNDPREKADKGLPKDRQYRVGINR